MILHSILTQTATIYTESHGLRSIMRLCVCVCVCLYIAVFLSDSLLVLDCCVELDEV